MVPGIVLGVISGLTVGLLAVGLVLVYKASRFLNLAHGQLGTLSAVLLATLVLNHGWSWWVAFPVVLALGIGLGVAVERLIIRPLRHQGRSGVTFLLVTIGIGQLLLALTFIPAFNPDPTRFFREQYPLPISVSWGLGGANLTGQHVMILVVAPVMVAVLTVFLRYSTLGKSIRAAASNPDSARLCGISVDRVNVTTWAIAGALSAVTAVLLAPGQSVFNAQALGPGLLLRALGAAALGGFVSIPAAMVGGVSLGVIEWVTLSVTRSGSSAELAVFVAVIAVLLTRGRQISAAAFGSDEVAEDRPPTRVPVALAQRWFVRSHRLLLGATGVVLASLLPLLPYFNQESHRFSLVVILVLATVGISLTMLLGWAGQVSLGHFALLGMGAFIAAKLAPDGRSLPVILLLAGLGGAVAMALVGLPALRLRGLSLAVTTLGFAVVAPAWLFVQPWFGAEGQTVVNVGELGMAGLGALESQLSMYYAALALLVLTAVVTGALRRSVPGRLIVAARDNERALASFGITPATVKVATLAASGFLVASAGVIWGAAWGNVSVDLVPPPQSLAILAIPVVGGLGSIGGAVAASFLLYMPAFFLAPWLTGVLGEFGRNLGFQLALGGLGLVAMPLIHPPGLAGIGQHAWERLLEAIDPHRGRARQVEETEPGELGATAEAPVAAVIGGGARAQGAAATGVRTETAGRRAERVDRDGMCVATTKRGTRCRRRATSASGLTCRQHETR